MSRTTATVLVVAVLLLLGVGALALTPTGRNFLAQNDTYPGVPNTGSTNVYNTTYNSTTTSVTPRPVPQRHLVTFEGSAFSPKTVVIAKGDSVTILNNSTSSIRVAGLPGFDILGTIPSGGTWSHDFNSTGVFNYGNALNSSQTGTIVVQ